MSEPLPTRSLEFHDLCMLFPQLDSGGLEEMARDVKVNGLRQPIVTYQGKILDGRNRLYACRRAHVPPRFEEYQGTDPLGHVISLNLMRRHLNTAQRASVAAKIANLKQGRPDLNAQICAITQDDAAQKLNVSRRSVQSAGRIIHKAAPEIVSKMERGEISVFAAEKTLRPVGPEDHSIRSDSVVADTQLRSAMLAHRATLMSWINQHKADKLDRFDRAVRVLIAAIEDTGGLEPIR